MNHDPGKVQYTIEHSAVSLYTVTDDVMKRDVFVITVFIMNMVSEAAYLRQGRDAGWYTSDAWGNKYTSSKRSSQEIHDSPIIPDIPKDLVMSDTTTI